MLEDELKLLREQLGEVDRQLIALIGRRQALSLEIGARKMESGVPTRDFAQEKAVVGRAVDAATAHGVSDRLARRMILLLIEASLTAQERTRVERRARGGGHRVLIIGGAGKMGGWMARFLSSQDYEVDVADPRGATASYPHVADWRESSLDHDVVVVAAPLRVSKAILAEMAADPPKGLLFDIASLKSPLRSELLDLVAAGANVTSVHPMFGPDTELLSGRHVIFVDVGVPGATRMARALFDSTMAEQVEMSIELHDRVIAHVLGLSHALNIAFFTALARSGQAMPRLSELSSATFDAQLDVAAQVASENPHLYFEIQSLNEYGDEALEALERAVSTLRKVVREGDEASFVELMEQGRAYLGRRARED